jgi:DNA-binding transcriptional LysR family regulator
MGITQPTVSKRLQALEASLGVRLVERNTRGLRPTEAGPIYYEQCKRWLAEIEKTEEDLLAMRKGTRGKLRLSVPVNIGQVQLARIAFSFQRQYPGVQIDLSLTDDIVDLVKDGVDVAIRIGRLGSATIVARKLARYRPILVGSPSYLQRRGTPTNLADLRHHRVMIYGARPESLSHRGRSIQLDTDSELLVTDPLVLREAIREGIALGLLSPWLVQQDLERGALVRVLPESEGEEFLVHAVHLPSRTLPARVRAFLAHCQAEVPRIAGLVRP